MNLLVTSISRKVPLLRSAAAALAARGGGQLHGGDCDGGCAGRHCVDRFWEMPRTEALTLGQLVDYCRSHAIGALLPTRDGELPFFAAARAELAAAGIAVMVSAPDAVRSCQDKRLFERRLAAAGLPVIPTLPAPPAAGAVMVKERFGAGGGGASGPLAAADARAHAATLTDPLFQPFIAGREYSIDLYRDRTGRVQGAVARERLVVLNGESQVTRSQRLPALEALCAQVADHLDVYGHVVIQALLDAQGEPWLIECNARVGGASTLAFAMGLDSLGWFLREAAGERLDGVPFVRAAREMTLERYSEVFIL